MKKILLNIFVLSILFASCKKDHTSSNGTGNNNDNKLYHVTYNVSTFSGTLTGFNITTPRTNSLRTNTVTTSLGDVVDNLYYTVYDSVGNVVHQLTKKSTDVNFGSFSDDLPLGHYTIVVAGFKKVEGSHYQAKALATDYFQYAWVDQAAYDAGPEVSQKENLGYDDTFVSKFNLTVSPTNSPQNVVLKRIVAQVQIHIEDALPTTAANINAIVINDFWHFNVADTTRSDTVGNVIFFKVPTASLGTTGYTFSFLVLNTTQPFSIKLRYFTNNLTAVKVISNVTCHPNAVTLLTGKLFDGSTGNSNGGFQLTFNSDWDPVAINYGF